MSIYRPRQTRQTGELNILQHLRQTQISLRNLCLGSLFFVLRENGNRETALN